MSHLKFVLSTALLLEGRIFEQQHLLRIEEEKVTSGDFFEHGASKRIHGYHVDVNADVHLSGDDSDSDSPVTNLKSSTLPSSKSSSITGEETQRQSRRQKNVDEESAAKQEAEELEAIPVILPSLYVASSSVQSLLEIGHQSLSKTTSTALSSLQKTALHQTVLKALSSLKQEVGTKAKIWPFSSEEEKEETNAEKYPEECIPGLPGSCGLIFSQVNTIGSFRAFAKYSDFSDLQYGGKKFCNAEKLRCTRWWQDRKRSGGARSARSSLLELGDKSTADKSSFPIIDSHKVVKKQVLHNVSTKRDPVQENLSTFTAEGEEINDKIKDEKGGKDDQSELEGGVDEDDQEEEDSDDSDGKSESGDETDRSSLLTFDDELADADEFKYENPGVDCNWTCDDNTASKGLAAFRNPDPLETMKTIKRYMRSQDDHDVAEMLSYGIRSLDFELCHSYKAIVVSGTKAKDSLCRRGMSFQPHSWVIDGPMIKAKSTKSLGDYLDGIKRWLAANSNAIVKIRLQPDSALDPVDVSGKKYFNMISRKALRRLIRPKHFLEAKVFEKSSGGKATSFIEKANRNLRAMGYDEFIDQAATDSNSGNQSNSTSIPESKSFDHPREYPHWFGNGSLPETDDEFVRGDVYDHTGKRFDGSATSFLERGSKTRSVKKYYRTCEEGSICWTTNKNLYLGEMIFRNIRLVVDIASRPANPAGPLVEKIPDGAISAPVSPVKSASSTAYDVSSAPVSPVKSASSPAYDASSFVEMKSNLESVIHSPSVNIRAENICKATGDYTETAKVDVSLPNTEIHPNCFWYAAPQGSDDKNAEVKIRHHPSWYKPLPVFHDKVASTGENIDYIIREWSSTGDGPWLYDKCSAQNKAEVEGLVKFVEDKASNMEAVYEGCGAPTLYLEYATRKTCEGREMLVGCVKKSPHMLNDLLDVTKQIMIDKIDALPKLNYDEMEEARGAVPED